MKTFVKQYSLLEAQQGASLEISPEGELSGIPGSPGVAVGSVHTAEEFSLVQEGEVLVCPFTTPTWTVLFSKVAALVTDSGGALSHAATLWSPRAVQYRSLQGFGESEAALAVVMKGL